MSKRKSLAPSSNIGTASLLVIFLILCLVVFAALSLSTARNDYKHSVNLAEHKAAYYEASNSSEEIVAIVARVGGDEASINKEINKAGIDVDVSVSGGIAEWSVPISEAQSLSVELDCSNLNVNKWKVER